MLLLVCWCWSIVWQEWLPFFHHRSIVIDRWVSLPCLPSSVPCRSALSDCCTVRQLLYSTFKCVVQCATEMSHVVLLSIGFLRVDANALCDWKYYPIECRMPIKAGD